MGNQKPDNDAMVGANIVSGIGRSTAQYGLAEQFGSTVQCMGSLMCSMILTQRSQLSTRADGLILLTRTTLDALMPDPQAAAPGKSMSSLL